MIVRISERLRFNISCHGHGHSHDKPADVCYFSSGNEAMGTNSRCLDVRAAEGVECGQILPNRLKKQMRPVTGTGTVSRIL
jgi:hypothetical protein